MGGRSRFAIACCVAMLCSMAGSALAQESPNPVSLVDAETLRWASEPGEGDVAVTGDAPVFALFDGIDASTIDSAAEARRFLFGYKYRLITGSGAVSGLLGPQGSLTSGNFHYSAPAETNVLPSENVGAVVAQSESLLNECEGEYREIAIAVARPGLPTFVAGDEFVGNPGVGHNLTAAVAVSDCEVEFPYTELVDGGFQLFQTRVATWYWDDGDSATVVFMASEPTFSGDFTISASYAAIEGFDMSTAYKQEYSTVSWDSAELVDWRELGTLSLDEGAAVAPDPFGFLTASLSEGESVVQSDGGDGGLPGWLFAGGVAAALVFLLGLGWYIHRGRKPPGLDWLEGFLPPMGRIWVFQDGGAVQIATTSLEDGAEQDFVPVLGVRLKSPANEYRIGGWYKRSEDSPHSVLDVRSMDLRTNIRILLEGRRSSTTRAAVDRLTKHRVSVRWDEEQDALILVHDLDPGAPAADKVEIWISDDEKAIFLVDDPKPLLDAMRSSDDSSDEDPEGPTPIDGNVIPS